MFDIHYQNQKMHTRTAFPVIPQVVYYPAHLWKTAREDALDFIVRERKTVITCSSVLFIVTPILIALLLGATVMECLLATVVGVAALGLIYVAFFGAHLLYLTPKKLLADKQAQVDILRSELGTRNAEITVLKRSLAARSFETREN